MVIHDPDLNKIILVFAGTQVTDLIVWANNLNGELIDYPACGGNGCQVHAGFYADYQVGCHGGFGRALDGTARYARVLLFFIKILSFRACFPESWLNRGCFS